MTDKLNKRFTNMAENERMLSGEVYDEADQAQMRQQHEIEALTSQQFFKAEQHPNFDGVHCVNPDCEEPLPEARIKHGRIYCIHCQERIERKNR